MEWLGYELSADGIRATKEKAQAIQGLEPPQDVKTTRQLLGVMNYYSRFIPGLSVLNKPITRLLQKGVPFERSAKQQTALDKIKTEISKREALAPFETSSTRKVVLKCDACEDGMEQSLSKNEPTAS